MPVNKSFLFDPCTLRPTHRFNRKHVFMVQGIEDITAEKTISWPAIGYKDCGTVDIPHEIVRKYRKGRGNVTVITRETAVEILKETIKASQYIEFEEV